MKENESERIVIDERERKGWIRSRRLRTEVGRFPGPGGDCADDTDDQVPEARGRTMMAQAGAA